VSIWEKSLLLILLRRRLENERTIDWQTLHRRDRGWALGQPQQPLWRLLRGWLEQSGAPSSGGGTLFVYGASVVALLLGFALMAGLLTFQPLQRINLLWFLLIAVFLPLAWWLLALVFTAAQVPFPLRTLYEHRLPRGGVPGTLRPLLRQTVVALGQQLSLLFAAGMLVAFLPYLLLTDLAFGWSSTLDLGSGLIHRITSTLAWPWADLWPAAVPSVELIEQSHYFRSAPLAAAEPALFGQWWRFLLMCLLVYLLLPRLVTTGVARFRLRRMQHRVRDHDALISGLQQRLTSELIEQEASPVVQRAVTESDRQAEPSVSRYPQVVCWGIWPETEIATLRRQLAADAPGTEWLDVPRDAQVREVLERLAEMPDQPLLLLCKGWEPPTGELADFCQALAGQRGRLFLWPVPLAGMSASRQRALSQSWLPFMRQLPDGFHLIDGEPAAGGAHA
jgi:hypothetical protein